MLETASHLKKISKNAENSVPKIQIAHKNEVGHGIYTMSDIAHLLGFPRARVSRYLKNYWDESSSSQLFEDSYTWKSGSHPKEKAVNFYVLMELYTLFQLQIMGVSARRVVESRTHICEETGWQYPFATSSVLSDGKNIWYQFQDAIVNANGSRQTTFISMMQDFSQKIDFDEQFVAARFYPMGRDKNIVIDPNRQFGKPVVKGANVATEIIFALFESGESENAIATHYEISIQSVQDAILFHQNMLPNPYVNPNLNLSKP